MWQWGKLLNSNPISLQFPVTHHPSKCMHVLCELKSIQSCSLKRVPQSIQSCSLKREPSLLYRFDLSARSTLHQTQRLTTSESDPSVRADTDSMMASLGLSERISGIHQEKKSRHPGDACSQHEVAPSRCASDAAGAAVEDGDGGF